MMGTGRGMNAARLLPYAVAFLMIAGVAQAAGSTGIGKFSLNALYPVSISGQSCTEYGGYVYCVGGLSGTALTDATYFSSINSSAMGNWTATTRYPFSVSDESCVAYDGYIYCIGGASPDEPANASFYAQVGGSGIGNWTATTPYPAPAYLTGCAEYGGYVYCVGGINYTGYMRSTYSAPLGPSGIGKWSSGAAYPAGVAGESCAAYNGYMYCVGGSLNQQPDEVGVQQSNSTYFSSIGSGSLGPWTGSSSYPLAAASQSCAAYDGYLYCTGGYNGTMAAYNATEAYQMGLINSTAQNGTYYASTQLYTNATYYAQASASGIGQWLRTTPYPYPAARQSCIAYGGYLYCIGGAYYSESTNLTASARMLFAGQETTTLPPTTLLITTMQQNESVQTTANPTTTIPQGSRSTGTIILMAVIAAVIAVVAIYLYLKARS